VIALDLTYLHKDKLATHASFYPLLTIWLVAIQLVITQNFRLSLLFFALKASSSTLSSISFIAPNF